MITPSTGPVYGHTLCRVATQRKLSPEQAFRCSFGVNKVEASFFDHFSVVCYTPRGSQGLFDVRVLGIGDNIFAHSGQAFLYYPSPVLLSMRPSTGSSISGFYLTLIGRSFQSGSILRFSGTAGVLHPSLVSSSLILVFARSCPEGDNRIEIAGNGQDFETISNAFLCESSIYVEKIHPTVISGNSRTISIVGERFSQGSILACQFGRRARTDLELITSSLMSCRVPSEMFGNLSMSIYDSRNTRRTRLYLLHVQNPLSVVSINPSFACSARTLLIDVYGMNILPDSHCIFTTETDGVVSTETMFVTSSLVRCLSPEGFVGNLTLCLHNNVLLVGNSRACKPFVSYLLYDPEIVAVFPTSAPIFGGRILTIYGNNFYPTQSVCTVDDQIIYSKVVSISQMECVAPPHDPGPANLRVLSGDQEDITSEGITFKYVLDPTITSVSPFESYGESGLVLTVKGSHFADTIEAGCKLAGFPIKSLWLSSSQVECSVDYGLGAGDFLVEYTNDGQDYIGSQSVRVGMRIRMSSIEPSISTRRGGDLLKIRGSGLSQTVRMTCMFNEYNGSTVMDAQEGQFYCRTPHSLLPGSVRFSLLSDDGTSIRSNLLVEYIPDLVADSLFPSAGPSRGSIEVAVRGEYIPLSGSVRCVFGDSEAAGLVVTSSYMRCITPLSRQVGTVPFSIKVGQTAIGTSLKYEFVEPPEILGMIPSQGPTDGGTKVLMYGS
eukprot:768770-Hanusia_phi.AAC.1